MLFGLTHPSTPPLPQDSCSDFSPAGGAVGTELPEKVTTRRTNVKGEFRKQIRNLGLENADPKDIDALYDKWDSDHSGAIDMLELEAAFKEMKAIWKRKYGRTGLKPGVRRQIAELRARASAGKAAAAAAQRADACADELRDIREAIDKRVDVQLGMVITKRGIRIGEVIGSWTKSRGNAAKRELSRSEFKDEVERLGITQNGRPASRKVIGLLFDSVDTDKSGWLDLEEVCACACACACAHPCACACACARACARASACACARAHQCARACACARECACASPLPHVF